MTVQLFGRSSSHYTRIARIFAEELRVPYELHPILDMTSLDPATYGGNPALKLPSAQIDGAMVFGADHICHALAAQSRTPVRILWSEDLPDHTARNAQELTWHACQVQVQLAFGTQIAKLPADNVYFAKAARGLGNCLAWLDERLVKIQAALPARELSLLEVSLFCLLEHLEFRRTVAAQRYGRLAAFRAEFGERASARNTPYRFDA